MVARSSLAVPFFSSVVMAFAGSLLAAIPPGDPGRTYFAGYPLTVVVDGDFSDEAWQLAPRHAHTSRLSAQALREGRIETDPSPDADAAFEFAALADAQWLYVAVLIQDDALVHGEAPGCDVWSDDSVEIFIDPDASGGTSYDAADAQITIPLANLGRDPASPIVCGIQHPTQGVRAAVVQTTDGWAVEAAIALNIPGKWSIAPGDGTQIGFEIGLNDDDDGGDEDTILTWSETDLGTASQRPEVFGALVFASLPTEIHVPRDYPTIQEAVNAAPPGATVFISPGSYDEAITVDRSLQIVGVVPNLPEDVDPSQLASYDLPSISAPPGAIGINVGSLVGRVQLENLAITNGNSGVLIASREAELMRCLIRDIEDREGVGASGIAAVHPCQRLDVSHCLIDSITGSTLAQGTPTRPVYGIMADSVDAVSVESTVIAGCMGAHPSDLPWDKPLTGFTTAAVHLLDFQSAALADIEVTDVTGGIFFADGFGASSAFGILLESGREASAIEMQGTTVSRIRRLWGSSTDPFSPSVATGIRVSLSGSRASSSISETVVDDVRADLADLFSTPDPGALGIHVSFADAFRGSGIRVSRIVAAETCSSSGKAVCGILLDGSGPSASATMQTVEVHDLSAGGIGDCDGWNGGTAWGTAIRGVEVVELIDCHQDKITGGIVRSFEGYCGGDGGPAIALEVEGARRVALKQCSVSDIFGGSATGDCGTSGGSAAGFVCDSLERIDFGEVRVSGIRGGLTTSLRISGIETPSGGDARAIVCRTEGQLTIEGVSVSECLGGDSIALSVLAGGAVGLEAAARDMWIERTAVSGCAGGHTHPNSCAQTQGYRDTLGMDLKALGALNLRSVQVTDCLGGSPGGGTDWCVNCRWPSLPGGAATGIRVSAPHSAIFISLVADIQGGNGLQRHCGTFERTPNVELTPARGGDAVGILFSMPGVFTVANSTVARVAGGAPGVDHCRVTADCTGDVQGSEGKATGILLPPSSSFTLRDSILAFYASGTPIAVPMGQFTEDHNCFYGRDGYDVLFPAPAPSTLVLDPLFVDSPHGAYYLGQTAAGQAVQSPCIDAGSASASFLGLDFATTRTDHLPDTGIVDIGFHYPGSVEPPANLWLIPPFQSICRAHVPVFMRSHQEVRGFTLGLSYDLSSARIEDILMGPDLESIGVDFYMASTTPASCADGPTGATLAAVVSLEPPLRTLPAYTNLEVAGLVVRARKTG
ncbi:MAG: hypothetical protein JXQ75_20410, partial [Phycisphaerae bacterium]|nr:hypothetical protein [Phycisphaerae bacterium]